MGRLLTQFSDALDVLQQHWRHSIKLVTLVTTALGGEYEVNMPVPSFPVKDSWIPQNLLLYGSWPVPSQANPKTLRHELDFENHLEGVQKAGPKGNESPTFLR